MLVLGLGLLPAFLTYIAPKWLVIFSLLIWNIALLALSSKFFFWTFWSVLLGFGLGIGLSNSLEKIILIQKNENYPVFQVENLKKAPKDKLFKLEGGKLLWKLGSVKSCGVARNPNGPENCVTYHVAPWVTGLGKDQKIIAWLSVLGSPTVYLKKQTFLLDPVTERFRPSQKIMNLAREDACKKHKLCAPNAPLFQPVPFKPLGDNPLEMLAFLMGLYSLIGWLSYLVFGRKR